MWRNSPALAAPSGSCHGVSGEARQPGEHDECNDKQHDGDDQEGAEGVGEGRPLGRGVQVGRCRSPGRVHGYLYTTHVLVAEL